VERGGSSLARRQSMLLKRDYKTEGSSEKLDDISSGEIRSKISKTGRFYRTEKSKGIYVCIGCIL
jgi:hypothetical protein